jgi:hypothetical protein
MRGRQQIVVTSTAPAQGTSSGVVTSKTVQVNLTYGTPATVVAAALGCTGVTPTPNDTASGTISLPAPTPKEDVTCTFNGQKGRGSDVGKSISSSGRNGLRRRTHEGV